MKKLIFTFLFLVASVVTYGQTCYYNQSFEIPVTGVTSTGTPGFAPDTLLYHDGVQSYLGTFNVSDSAVLTTDSVDLQGSTFVILKFWHICKLQFFDEGVVEVSDNGGLTWTQLTCTNSQYLGGSASFCVQANKFTEATYPGEWHFGDTITQADSSWWKEEQFDVSALLGSGSVTNAMVRFIARDKNTPNNGLEGRQGWFIDEICLLGAPCELTDPLSQQTTPVYGGTVYNLGPYPFNCWAADASGLQAVYLLYWVNGVGPNFAPMFNPTADSNYTCTIPAVNDSDTICYNFYIQDASACGNDIYYPDPLGLITGANCFIASSGIRFPYCDDFDVNLDLWADSSSLAGSNWELGTPNFGLTNTPHTAPNSWDISLSSGYLTSTEAYLISPVFNTDSLVNGQLSFWYNCATNNFNEDGARLETSVDGGTWTTLTIAQDPGAINWYNSPSISSSGEPAWTGFSNGWKEAKFNLSNFNNVGSLQFRFVFTSETFSTGDGFSIDDFCIVQPEPEDMGVDKVIEPFPSSGAGSTSNAIVRVRNFGTVTQAAFDVLYSINGVVQGPPVAYTGPPLAPNDTAIVTLSPTFVVPPFNYDFCAWTVLPTDANTANDTLCVVRQGIPVVPVTYCNDFDTNAGDWTSIPSPIGTTVWELGTPAFGATNSAFSNPNSWDINLTTAYDNDAYSLLVSPFFDFTNAHNVGLSFWQNRNTETNWDGTHLEYSVNGSTTWQTLGVVGSPGAVNWYTNIINSCNCEAWAGNSNGWVQSKYGMSQFDTIGLVQLQYVFTSDGSVLVDGASIDNFCLTVPPPIDIGVDTISSPTANAGAGQSVDVIARVRNYGSAPVSAFDVAYIQGANSGTVSYTGPPLAPNDTVSVTIPPQIVVPTGLFCMQAYTVLVTDMDHTNDTLNACMFGVPVVPLNYCNDFDLGIADWLSVPSPTGNSVWELGTPNFQNVGAHSAPNAWDVNLTTSYDNNAVADLYSPFFDFTGATNVQLSFWNRWDTETGWDGTRLDYSQAGGPWTMLGNIGLGVNWYTNTVNSSTLPAWAGSSANLPGSTNGWVRSEFDMSQFNNGGLVQLRFEFTSDAIITVDGASIDDFCLKIPPPFDGGVVSIDVPSQQGLAIGASYPITVTVRNYGQNPISNFPVVYTVNALNPQSTNYPGTLNFNQTGTLILTPNLTAIPLSFDVCAWTEVPNDGDATNDTVCRTYVGVPIIYPTYTDDFDGVNNGWTINNVAQGSQWELGAPTFGATSTSHSPPNCWDVNLITGYTNNANCELISPFFDFSTITTVPEISFWINYNTQLNGDGARLDYSSDGGFSYSTLGSVGAANTLNWYPSTIGFPATPAWNGNSGGWIFAKDSDLSFLSGNVLPVVFKFVFTSNGFTPGDGVSIDDFMVYRPITITAATDSVYPANNILTPGPQFIVGQYLNSGVIPMTKVLLSLVVDGTLLVTDTIDPIPGGTPLNHGVHAPPHTFSLPWNASPGQHDFCIYTSMPNDSIDLDNTDDTTCTVLTVFDSTSVYPYCSDFESPPQWVTLNSVTYNPVSTCWQIGTPVKTNIIGAHSGANCWVTGLVSEYPDDDNSSLFSPVFNVLGGKCYELSFWHNDDMDLFNDGGAVEYSIDSAKSWRQLGDGGDDFHWYNSNYIAAFGGPPLGAGWTGMTGGWLESKHNWECLFNGQVIFRWRFASDLTNTADGWAIDDVCFKEVATPCVTAIGEVPTNQFYLYQNAPNPVNGKTSIAFSLPKSGKAVMTVTNLVGQEVAILVNEKLGEGRHTVDLNSKDFAPGIYYYTLKFDGRKLVRKMVIVE